MVPPTISPMLCSHSLWVRLCQDASELKLQITDRPTKLLKSFVQPEKDTTQSIVLVGSLRKQSVLQQLGVCPGVDRRSSGNELHLSVAQPGAWADRNLFVVDHEVFTGPRRRLPGPHRPKVCHEVSDHAISVQGGYSRLHCAQEALNRVLCRSAFPLADVVCLFAEDVGGVDEAAECVAAWMECMQTSPSHIQPFLILAVEQAQERVARQKFLKLARRMNNEDPEDYFQCIKIVGMLGSWPQTRQGPVCRRWSKLQTEIRRCLDAKYRDRQNRRLTFSARHTSEYLRYAAPHSVAQETPLDFIQVSRTQRQVPPDLEVHLTTFLRLFRTTESVVRGAIPIIASALVLDHYPPGQHDSDPGHVFRTLYRDVCRRAYKASLETSEPFDEFFLPAGFVALLEHSICQQFDRYLEVGAAEAHRSALARARDYVSDLSSEAACLSCLASRPQYALPCVHMLCQTCVWRLGRRSDSCSAYLSHCPLCETQAELTIRKKPDTASPRVLSLDGGGARGIASLAILQVIEEAIGLPCPIQHLFDVVVGTSSGSIIAGALCINGWSVTNSIPAFESLSWKAFRPRPLLQDPLSSLFLPSSWWAFVSSLLFDSRYSAANLESALKGVFGSERSILEGSIATERGIMVGMPIATNSSDTIIATNYNGVGSRDGNQDYEILRSDNGIRRIPLWELLRCSTAAPYYFKPHYIPGVGWLQDGGMSSYINPAELGMRESSILYPKTSPHLVVSIGNGASRSGLDDFAGDPDLGSDSFIVRAYQSLCNNLNPRRAWRKLLAHHSVAADCEFFRFDPEFDGPEPELDSVKDMGMVKEIASRAALDALTLPKLKQHARAELFYFELIDFPSQNNGYLCYGQILCRLDAASGELDTFMSQLAQEEATFAVKNQIIPIIGDRKGGSSRRTQFCKKIRFRVLDREEQFHITLNEGGHPAARISGSPFTVSQLIHLQQLDSWFGRADHRELVAEADCGPDHDENESMAGESAWSRGSSCRKRGAEADEPQSVKYRRTTSGRKRRA